MIVPVRWLGERDFVFEASDPAACAYIPLPLLPLCSPLLVGLLPRAVFLEGRRLYAFDPSRGCASAGLGRLEARRCLSFQLFVDWGPYQDDACVSVCGAEGTLPQLYPNAAALVLALPTVNKIKLIPY